MEQGAAEQHSLICGDKPHTCRNLTMKASAEGRDRTLASIKRLSNIQDTLAENMKVFVQASKEHSKQPSVLTNDRQGRRRRRLSDGSIKIVD